MISDNQIAFFMNALATAIAIAPSSVSYEIQDDGEFLLVNVRIGADLSSDRHREILWAAQNLALQQLPSRDGEYSWMINLTQDNKIIDSIFGGDRLSPLSGLLN